MEQYTQKCYSGELQPCPRCKAKEEIIISDCGYSSFNIGEAKCKKCNFSVNITCSVYPSQEIANAWNETAEFLKKVEKFSKEDLINYVKASYLNSNNEFREIILEKTKTKQIFKEKCSVCHGYGSIMKQQGFFSKKEKCKHCNGTGEF